MPTDYNIKQAYQPSLYMSYRNGVFVGSGTDGPACLTSEDLLVRDSVTTPRFGSLRKGQLPENPFGFTRGTRKLGVVKCSTHFLYTGGGTARNDYVVSPKYLLCEAADVGFPGSDPYPQAFSRLVDEVKLCKGSLAVGIAEVGKTMDHLTNTALRLSRAFVGLKKGRLSTVMKELGFEMRKPDKKKFRYHTRLTRRGGYVERIRQGEFRIIKSSSDSLARRSERTARAWWLEITYGWKPLLQDIQTQAENLARYQTAISQQPRKVVAKAKTRELYQSDQSWSYAKVFTTADVVRRTKLSIKYRVPVPPDLKTQFGLTDLALVAWEVIPFSFVFDWILPVGNYLESLSAFNGLEFSSGTLTQSYFKVIKSGLVPKPAFGTNPKTWLTMQSETNVTNNRFNVNRYVLTSFPAVPYPRLKNPLSFAHMASALALLSTIFKR